MKTSRATLLALAFLILTPAMLLAQDGARRTIPRIPMTVALVAQLPRAGEPFAVLRRMDAAPHDVILIPESATAELLSDAIQTLVVARQASGDLPGFTGYVRTKPHGQQATHRRTLPWAGRVLGDVRKAEPAELTGIGRVRSVQIWLPPQHAQGGPAR
jgi:hypothetical protein